MYSANPQRECGTKKQDSFYLEGGEFGEGGALWPLSYILGTGYPEDALAMEIAPLGMQWFNPAATLAVEELVLANGAFEPADDDVAQRYDHFQTCTKSVGLIDHVGGQYTAHSFANELAQYGPSRKVPPKLAQQVGEVHQQIGSIPIWFTQQIPIFRDEAQMKEAILLVDALLDSVDWDGKNYQPTWLHADWGQYASENQYRGIDHFLLPILSCMDAIQSKRRGKADEPVWGAFKEFMAEVDVREQLYACSWITTVTYTMPKEGQKKSHLDTAVSIPAINLLDLSTVQEG